MIRVIAHYIVIFTNIYTILVIHKRRILLKEELKKLMISYETRSKLSVATKEWFRVKANTGYENEPPKFWLKSQRRGRINECRRCCCCSNDC